MNRFNQLFEDPQKRFFLPYFTLGYPNPDKSLALIKAAIDAGADALELGIPFSDPVADGPSNQRAMACALKAGMNFDKALEMIAEIRAYNADIPIGLLLYYNLIFKRGMSKAHADLKAAGVDALVTPELPLEESAEHEASLKQHDLGCVHMVFPNSPIDRVKESMNRSTAFAYVVARMGPTGASSNLSDDLKQRIDVIREFTQQPIVVGFGLSQPEHVKSTQASGANGAIVASKFADWIDEDVTTAEQKITDFIRACR
jgi:tryptophan synthase alpha chain